MKGYGLNLFSLRHAIKTRDDFLATACRLRDMGYSYLQFSGAPFDAALIGEVSRSADIPVVLTHVPLDRILGDTDALMREHETFGCRNIGLSRLNNSIITDRDLCYKTVERLNLAAEKMRAQGFEFFYHNHHTDLFRLGDKTVLDYMIEEAPAISFTLDVYWLQYGGVSILEYINKLKGRIACVHLKDYRIISEEINGELKLRPTFAPVGEGTINFHDVIPAALSSGTEYFFVEQDNAPQFPDPFDEVRRSVNYLKREFDI